MRKRARFAIFAVGSLIVCLIFSKAYQLLLMQPYADASLPAYSETVTPTPTAIEDIVFPADGGVINVKNAPYNAKGDGVTDDTVAIQMALSAYPNGNKIIYLPNGTYVVSQRLEWPAGSDGKAHKRTILQGQNTTKTVIKLSNSAPGFTNPRTPQAVIWTGNAPAQRFRNAIRNLTVDTGTGNRGAIALQFIANNQGSIRNVVLKSGDGQGAIGLDLAYTDEVGPCLIKNVEVIGFNRGISTGHTVNSQTFEHISLQNQREYGFYNGGQVINIRGLSSINTVPAIYNHDGVMTLLDAKLIGIGTSRQSAIKNEATLFARNITTSAYPTSIQNNSGTYRSVTSSTIAEFVSHPIYSLSSTQLKSLNLPIQETPEILWDPLSDWISPTHFGAVPDDKQDDSVAIQSAIDSGRSTVYFPNGIYHVEQPIYIRNNVRRIIGLEASIAGTGMFQFQDGSASEVIIERLDGMAKGILHAASRTLILSSMGLNVSGGSASYTNIGSGDLYIEDVVGAPWIFNKQKVWARQINAENDNATHLANNGGILWILGLKTERGGIIIDTNKGGKTEVAGGFIYSTSGFKNTPMFTNNESSVSMTIGECNYNGNPFNTLVAERRRGFTKTLSKRNTLQRCNGSTLPLYVGY